MKYPAVIIVLVAAPLVSAPPPKVIREVVLSQITPVPPGFRLYAGIAFSPDEKWVAVAVETYQIGPRKADGNVDHGSEILLLMPLKGPEEQTVQIDPGVRRVVGPIWSPNSAAVLVQGIAPDSRRPYTNGIGKLWDLKGKELLRRDGPGFSADGPVGGTFGFLDAEHLLARRIPAKGTPAAFETINLRGQVVATWTVPKHWKIVDISPDRGLLAVLPEYAPKTLIVDYASKKVVLAKGNPHGDLGQDGGSFEYFTEGGKTMCSVGSVGTFDPQWDTATECWDVDLGRKIAQFDGFPGGAPAAASSHGSRLVLTRVSAFPKRSGAALVYPVGERVVWDFRSGAEIAAWDLPLVDWTSANHFVDSVAISSSGRYVAETDGVVFRMYELP